MRVTGTMRKAAIDAVRRLPMMDDVDDDQIIDVALEAAFAVAERQQIFEINGEFVQFNPGARFHGWLFRRHPDGQLVSVRKLEEVPLPADPFFAQQGPS